LFLFAVLDKRLLRNRQQIRRHKNKKNEMPANGGSGGDEAGRQASGAPNSDYKLCKESSNGAPCAAQMRN
jgi:hypothetical protein